VKDDFNGDCRLASFFVKNLTVDEEIVRFQIWDTAGQERYNSLAPMYYRGAEAALLVFDISDRVRPMVAMPCSSHGLSRILIIGHRGGLKSFGGRSARRK